MGQVIHSRLHNWLSPCHPPPHIHPPFYPYPAPSNALRCARAVQPAMRWVSNGQELEVRASVCDGRMTPWPSMSI